MITSEEFLDFVCVAAPRSGTTWLSEALKEHPQVWIPPMKEVNFFNGEFLSHRECKYLRGIDYYRKQFEKAPQDATLGELTPIYYADPNVASRIHKHFPDARILILLRNPAEVVFSTYLKTREVEKTENTFELAIQKRPELMSLGFYHRLLTPYFDLFPKEHIHVRIYEFLFASIEEEYTAICRFLGIDDLFKPSILEQRVNPRRVVRWPILVLMQHYLRLFFNSRLLIPLKKFLTQSDFLDRLNEGLTELNLKEGSQPKLDAEMRNWLLAQYEADIVSLEKLLDVDLDIWRQSKS